MAECNGDSCDVAESSEWQKMTRGLSAEARAKLADWLCWEPMDYDAPGSTVRETGV